MPGCPVVVFVSAAAGMARPDSIGSRGCRGSLAATSSARNLDPSHLMWMGADISTVIRTLGDAIFHVHAKDIRINDWIAARDGLLDTVPITEPGSRAWNYVTLGLGHRGGATFWADFVDKDRSVGYDDIEHRGRGCAGELGRDRHVAFFDPPDWTPAKV